MGEVIQFPGKKSTTIGRLDFSITCIQNLQSASRLSSSGMRTEALRARVDIASVREELDSLLPTLLLPPGLPAEVQCLHRKIDGLLDQVDDCASFLLESDQVRQNLAVRAELRAACQSTLSALLALRSLLGPVTKCAEA
jgi:hypothetical protein